MLYLKSISKKNIFIVLLLILLGCSFLSLSAYRNYNTPTLIGKWKSHETNQVITFTEEGLVTFDNTNKTGVYTILSPSKMEYTIDNKTFIMYYYLEGRNLSWGINNDTLEHFSKSFVIKL
ncbi:hypothetical protein [Cellulosilyticum sp. I15G10I2]|uniref:hypothetical protein n=1 Tax=Cellulosilyticum sp. I15G10I2 TaxID=1892843 RepID=UPI00085C5471|nr:hypothetical protein [Cellulosilyticum sp. I15G10I2]